MVKEPNWAKHPNGPKARKTLLLVDERGNMKHVRWWKPAWVFCWTAIVILGAATAGFYSLWQSELNRNRLLQQDLDIADRLIRNANSRKAVTSRPAASKNATVEKPPIAADEPSVETPPMAKAPDSAQVPETPAADEAETLDSDLPNTPPEDEVATAAGDTNAAPPTEAVSPAAAPTENIRVAVEDLSFSKPRPSELQLSFRIRNVDDENRTLTGHLVAVLKGDGIPMMQWRAIPDVPLIYGQPDGNTEGETFGISNYKDVVLQSSATAAGEEFSAAAIYIFDSEGELMLAETHPISFE